MNRKDMQEKAIALHRAEHNLRLAREELEHVLSGRLPSLGFEMDDVNNYIQTAFNLVGGSNVH